MSLAFGYSAHAEPASASTLRNGMELFNENCAVCHQADGIGEPGVAPSLTNPELLSVASDKFFAGPLRHGAWGAVEGRPWSRRTWPTLPLGGHR